MAKVICALVGFEFLENDLEGAANGVEGRFPRPYKISPAAARWSEREIVAWVNDVKDGFEGKRRKV